ncbi:MAG TPA: hypothetical protein VFA26_17170 [Gemmataceae bacterium]|nr:hypothetical protein [Gemmataceae bacterium]
MRRALVVLAVVMAPALAPGREPPARYGVQPDLKTYPQATPKEALGSVLKAIDNKRPDYLLAQLADPEWVDRRVKGNGGRFEDLVAETRAKLLDDPAAARQLRRFLTEGEWEAGETAASVKLKDVSDRRVYLRKAGGRWFMENRRQPEAGPKKKVAPIDKP